MAWLGRANSPLSSWCKSPLSCSNSSSLSQYQNKSIIHVATGCHFSLSSEKKKNEKKRNKMKKKAKKTCFVRWGTVWSFVSTTWHRFLPALPALPCDDGIGPGDLQPGRRWSAKRRTPGGFSPVKRLVFQVIFLLMSFLITFDVIKYVHLGAVGEYLSIMFHQFPDGPSSPLQLWQLNFQGKRDLKSRSTIW